MIKQVITIGILIVVAMVASKALRDAAPTLSQVHTSMREISAVRETIQVAGRSVAVSVADTSESRRRGLSGLSGLGEDEGMLFVFQEEGYHTFWMKDMRFTIDIVWLSPSGKVVTIAHRVSPDTYPQSFAPTALARYVVELPAGYARLHGLREGDVVQL